MSFKRILPLAPSFALALSLALGASIAAAQSATPPAGDYIYERGSGQLRVKADGHFDITTIGANAHTCALDGAIVRGKARIDETTCVVNFAVDADKVKVTTNGADQCRDSCGARAMFEGTYTRPAPGCTDKAVAGARKTFKRQYDAKNYAAARTTLAPVLSDCDATLDWITQGWIRNDLALTQYKLDDRAACLKTLQPLAEDAALSDDGVKENYPPADAEIFLPVVRATRTNLKLCRG
ncbi:MULTISPECIES: hypothetical protein [unclassified Variovorax]|uniref:hypothetical protein n=1 Tax=unclassified Variovorax TaxID=663243 RepID=UPI0008D0F239|nr:MULTISPECIES: hypothetical protein [unclassified Variovorax]SEJ68250.1 hypothetical protein SAMN05518853_10361 [Variovorax sp. OK202]SFC77519.1 hypothetical protein SAMN05444746_10361 [Variovorax sp. OK212]